MPELPDVAIYVERIEALFGGQPLEQVRIASPFLVRSVTPPLGDASGRIVTGAKRLGKRIVFCLEGDLFLVLHLMVAGRLRLRPKGVGVPKKRGLAAFDFPDASLLLTEASTKKRASLYVVEGAEGLVEHDRGGYEVLDGDAGGFRATLVRENRTLKRALTDPRIFSGIGNAYSDEILFRAKLSPVKQTHRLDDDEVARLYDATCDILVEWTERTRHEVGDGFPDKVTAFRPEMAVHGRYREPCVVCDSPVQRIRYADNETNYCATCQNTGRLLADRSLSRLMKKDWPKTLDELEQKRDGQIASRRRGSSR